LNVKADWEHGDNQLKARRKEEKGKREQRERRGKLRRQPEKCAELRLLLSPACEGGKDGT
jgi:hypothetical protein